MIVKKIGVASAVKLFGIFYALVGLIVGLLISLTSVVGTDQSASALFPFGAVAMIFVPVFYGVLGVISGFIGAVFYNLAADVVGGLEIKL